MNSVILLRVNEKLNFISVLRSGEQNLRVALLQLPRLLPRKRAILVRRRARGEKLEGRLQRWRLISLFRSWFPRIAKRLNVAEEKSFEMVSEKTQDIGR